MSLAKQLQQAGKQRIPKETPLPAPVAPKKE